MGARTNLGPRGLNPVVMNPAAVSVFSFHPNAEAAARCAGAATAGEDAVRPVAGVRFRGLRAWLAAALLLLAGLLGLAAGPAAAQEDFLPPEEAFVFSAAMAGPGVAELRYRVAPKYYMYRERFAFSLEPDESGLGEPAMPDGLVKYDPTFEKNMEVYYGDVTIRVPVAESGQPRVLKVVSQGCADAGLCYPPMENRIELKPVAGGYELGGLAQSDAPGTSLAGGKPGFLTGLGGTSGASGMGGAGGQRVPGDGSGRSDAASSGGLSGLLAASDTGLAGMIAGSGWLATVGVFFLLGLLLAFTPCVLPMIPILSALIVGQRGGAGGAADADTKAVADGRRPGRLRGAALAAAYVLGMSVVYTLIGIAAGLSGVGLAAWLQTPWVLTVFALLLAVLALAMFDVFSFQMPAAAQARLSERAGRIPGGRFTGAALMGAVSALIVGPCVAAPLAGALLYISQTGDVALGGAALFAMAWGMGVPLLAVGASSGALLPRAGAWMDGVKRFFGVLLLATAWWMLIPVLPSWVLMLGWALLAAVAAVTLRAFDPLPEQSGAGRIFAKAAGLLLALASAALLVGVASGGRDPLQPLSHLAGGAPASSGSGAGQPGAGVSFMPVRSVRELEAVLAQADRPVMLDFYADWCVSCKEMERFTFTDPAVSAKMARMILVQADVTANNADDRALLRRFRLFGPPGIIFFAPGGRELDERVVGFQNAGRFDAALARVLAQQS